MLLTKERRTMLETPRLAGHNRYGEGARLPDFDPTKHVPVIGLINPGSGAGAGADILELCRCTKYYKRRFFNIVEVVKGQRRGGLMDIFRIELQLAREEARAMK